MKPPKCRLCETAHWSREPHVFKDVATVATRNVATDVTDVATFRGVVSTSVKVLGRRLQKPKGVLVLTEASDSARVQRWREANRERYNKRMREYRKRLKETPA